MLRQTRQPGPRRDGWTESNGGRQPPPHLGGGLVRRRSLVGRVTIERVEHVGLATRDDPIEPCSPPGPGLPIIIKEGPSVNILLT